LFIHIFSDKNVLAPKLAELQRLYELRTGNVEDTDLAEDYSLGQRGEHRGAIVRHDGQLASLDDVQLLTDVTLATHVVAGTEHGQLELEYQLYQ